MTMRIKIAIVIVTVLFLAAYVLIMWLWILTPEPPPTAGRARELSPSERRWSEARMRYHGIMSFICDEKTGECYFYRDGKRCPL